MSFETWTLKSIRARPVVLKLARPVAARALHELEALPLSGVGQY
jgi:hypothetical protein